MSHLTGVFIGSDSTYDSQVRCKTTDDGYALDKGTILRSVYVDYLTLDTLSGRNYFGKGTTAQHIRGSQKRMLQIRLLFKRVLRVVFVSTCAFFNDTASLRGRVAHVAIAARTIGCQ